VVVAAAWLAGCQGQGGARLKGAPLLPPGSAIDLVRVSEAVWAREAAGGFEALSAAEQVFLCVWNLEAEVNNGGFEQFYTNSAGDNAAATVKALREIGATEVAAIAEEANHVFPPPGPPADRTDRAVALARLGDVADGAFDALDERFYHHTENLDDLLLRFVDRNRNQFFAAP
jgi:hypothetical protein